MTGPAATPEAPRAAAAAAPERASPEAPGPARERRTLAPSVFDIFFVAIALAVPIRWHKPLLNADGDLSIHLRMGELILQNRRLYWEDLFHYTMLGEPFVPFSWLTQVVLALANRFGGLPGVAVLAGLVLATTYGIVALFLRSRRVDARLALLTVLLALASGAIHWLPRPHIFTLLASAALIPLLEQRRLRLWPFAVLFVIWSNLHGGFVYGLILMGLYVAGDVAEGWLEGRESPWWARARRHALALAVAFVAALANPAGLALLAQIGGSLGSEHMVNTTVEYRSPDFHLFGHQVFLAILLLVTLALALGRRGRMPLPWLLVVLANVFFAFYAVRNIPLFGVTALPLLALHASRQFSRAREGYLFGDDFVAMERRSIPGVWALVAVALVVALAANRGRVGGLAVVPEDFDPRHFPVAAVDWAREHAVQGRLFSEFIWSGWMIRAWPEQKVFVSSQRYPRRISRAYLDMYELGAGWRERLEEWRIDLAVLPVRSRLAYALANEEPWALVYCDRTAAIFARGAPAEAAPAFPVPADCLDPPDEEEESP